MYATLSGVNPRAFRIDVAARAVALARERSALAEFALRRVSAEAIALMRTEGLSDRKIAGELGVSKSSIRAMAQDPEPDSPGMDKQADRLKHEVWLDTVELAGNGFVVDGDDMSSYERMELHGIVPALRIPGDHADTISREYLQVTTGVRILVYSQSRRKGNPDDTADSGWDNRGSYLVERCPGLDRGVCAAEHAPVPLEEFGLRADDNLYGTGWDERRPTSHQVWKLITAAIEESLAIFDPTYPELELRRRPGTAPRYGSGPNNIVPEHFSTVGRRRV